MVIARTEPACPASAVKTVPFAVAPFQSTSVPSGANFATLVLPSCDGKLPLVDTKQSATFTAHAVAKASGVSPGLGAGAAGTTRTKVAPPSNGTVDSTVVVVVVSSRTTLISFLVVKVTRM